MSPHAPAAPIPRSKETPEIGLAEGSQCVAQGELGFAPVAILADASGLVRGISGAGTEFLGWSVDELIGRSLLAVVSPPDDSSHPPTSGNGSEPAGDLESEVSLAKSLLRSSESRPMDVLCRTKEGTWARAQLLANALGPLINGAEGYSCILFGWVNGPKADVHEKAPAPTPTASSASGYVWEIDRDGSFIVISEQAENAFALPTGSIVGFNIASFVPKSIEESTRQWLEQLVSEPAPFRGKEYFVHLDDGSIRVHLLSGKPILGPEGDLLGFRGTGLDVTTERNVTRPLREAQSETNKEAQSKLRDAYEAERRRSDIEGRLIAMTSHEFRTPLAAIRLAAELIQSRTVDPWTARKADTIMSKVDFLESVVSDVLDLQRIRDSRVARASKSNLKLETLSAVIHRVLEEFESEADQAQRIVLDLADNAETLVPTFLVSRIVRNLVENALKYSPETSPIVVRSSDSPGHVEVDVIDGGPGVPSEDSEHIFNEFFRGANSTFVRGSGLGLPIAREAALRLGGSLTYRRDPGGYTVFSLQFPL